VESKAEKLKEDGGFGVVMESLKERGEVMKKNSVVYKCSSWCRFPLGEVDFGWGEAVWACSVNKMVSNTIALMDTRDGGVEAFVTLDHHHMLLFQQHHHLLHYALLNPSVILWIFSISIDYVSIQHQITTLYYVIIEKKVILLRFDNFYKGKIVFLKEKKVNRYVK